MARVRELFHLALDSGLSGPPLERWLSEACKDDPSLQPLVLDLLRADAQAIAGDAQTSGPAGPLSTASHHSAVPARLGRYTLGRLLGRGGMGAVYLASQSNPDRQVALKILPTAASSLGLRARFDREIRALARLEHPAIARLYDAGQDTAPEGEFTYFAMEYVRGPNLIDFARNNALDLAQRIALLARVADGVQHAHARGVLHRDLKPANVLVTDEDTRPPSAALPADPHASAAASAAVDRGPSPKILDFGVARMIGPDTSHTALTHHGLLVGTVAYMSPEQLSGDPDAVDTRSDIYALGVILHQLVTGTLPVQVTGLPLAQAARRISDHDPSPARTLLAHDNSRVDRDLVTILDKTMAREKDRRYASAGELADDLRRFLRTEPITARPPTALYHLTKFARRNRPLTLALGVAALAVLAGLAASSILYIREQHAARNARREADLSAAVRTYLINDLLLAASPKRRGYDVRMMDVLTDAAKGLEDRFADYPEIEAEVRMDLATVFNDLGRPDDSLLHATRARDLFHTLTGPDSPRTIQAIIRMAQAHSLRHDAPAALALAQDAAARADRALPAASPVRAWAHGVLGAVLAQGGKATQAIASLNTAISIFDTADASAAEAVAARSWLASALLQSGDVDRSLAISRDNLARLEQANGPAAPSSLAARNNLVNALLAAQRWPEAAELAAPLPDLLARTLPPGDQSIIFGCLTTAAAMVRADRFPDAERHALRAHQLALAGFDDLHWVTEKAVTTLRHIYARWPDRRENLWSWQQQALRIRLMVATPAEHDASVNLLREVVTLQAAARADLTAPEVLSRLWLERDRLAPPGGEGGAGHARRAVFLANFARLAAQADPAAAQEALRLARVDAGSAADPAAAQAAIQAAAAALEPTR
jgi:serine/threonine protein kinase